MDDTTTTSVDTDFLFPRLAKIAPAALGVAILAGLILTSRINYLLFHGLVELFSIAVAWSVFMLAWNARRHMGNDALLLLGIASLSVGCLDLVHTLGYKGMGVFPGYGADLPTQLWIAARAVHGLSFLAGALLLGSTEDRFSQRRWAPVAIIAVYGVLTALAVWVIFVGAFPTCYVEGVGLTPFKRISEYAISLIFLLSGAVFWRRRAYLERHVLHVLLASIGAMAAAELAFTLYVGVYDIFNVLGHIFKVAAFYALYRAIIHTGLRQPYAFLSRDLRESESRLRNYVDHAPHGILISDETGRFVDVNPAASAITGYTRGELLSMSVQDLVPVRDRAVSAQQLRRILEEGRIGTESSFQREDGSVGTVLLDAVRLSPTRVLGFVRDITAQRRAEDILRESEARHRRFLDASEDLAFVKDADLRYVMANRPYQLFLGRPEDEILGRTDDQLMPEATARGCRNTDMAALRQADVVVNMEMVKGRVYETRKFPVQLGEQTGVGAVIRDVTDRTLIEQEVRRSEARLRSMVRILQHPVETLESFFEFIVTEATELTESEGGYAYSYDEARRQLTFESLLAQGGRVPRGPRLRASCDLDDAGIWGEPVRQRKAIVQNGVIPSQMLELGFPEGHPPINRYLMVPVFSGNEIVAGVGVVNKPSDYTQADELQLTLLVDAVWKVVDRQRAQAALAQERRLLRTVIDNLPDAIYAKDTAGRKTLANRADVLFSSASGVEAAVLGKTDFELYPRETAERFWADDQRVLRTGEPVRDVEERAVDAEGCERWVSTSKYPLRDGAGEIVGLTGTGRDITAQKKAQIEREQLLSRIEAQARRMAQILENVPQGVVVVDAAGNVLRANPLAEGYLAIMTGSDSGVAEPVGQVTELGGRPLAALLAPPERGLWHEVEAAGRTFEILAGSLDQADAPDEWVMVINDVTESRQVRDQLQRQERLAAVGQLAAGIAHDFNNIMAVIVLHAQMVTQAQELSVPDLARLNTISRQARHATQLISQILDFSRQSVLDRHPLDLQPLVKEEVRMLSRTLPEHIVVTLDCDAGEHVVDADPTRIQQLIMNLAINARDAMPAGGKLRIGLAHVVIGAHQTPPVAQMAPGAWVRLSVSDTGTGIAPEAIPHLYEPFYTTKVQGTGAGKGSGLGLAQVHGIVGQHGGHIALETALGKGTTFNIQHLSAGAGCAGSGGERRC